MFACVSVLGQREGCAVADLMHPDRIVIGAQSKHAITLTDKVVTLAVGVGPHCGLTGAAIREVVSAVACARLARASALGDAPQARDGGLAARLCWLAPQSYWLR